MVEFFERRAAFKETPKHQKLARMLFLKRWEILEPKEYEVWKTTYVDTECDRYTTSLIAEAYYINLQEQHRFPDDKKFFKFVDEILSQPDLTAKKQKIKTFLHSPDPHPRTSLRRVGRFASDGTDTISA